MSSASFTRLATVTASTKRPPALSGGNRGVPATKIASLKCLPLMPASENRTSEIQERPGLSSPVKLLTTFVDSALDIAEGDILVIGSASYSIKTAESWPWLGSTYLKLTLEDIKA